MTKKVTIFDFLKGLTSSKKPWDSWNEEDKKAFSPYMINRWLSMHPDLTETINELQKYTIGLLSSSEVYNLYLDILPKASIYSKYITGNKSMKYESGLISQIAEHYEVSKTEAMEYVDMLNKDQCSAILEMYGYQTKEITKLLKGVGSN